MLRFVTRNESVTPAPGPGDPIRFDWRVWVRYQVFSPRTVGVLDRY